MDRLRSARIGSAQLGLVRLGSDRLGWARLDPARLGAARFGLDRDNSARLDQIAKNDDPTKRTVRMWLDKASGRRRALILRLPTSRNAILDGSEKHFPGSRDDFGTAKEPPMSAKLRPLQPRILKFEHFFIFFKNLRISKNTNCLNFKIPVVAAAALHSLVVLLRFPNRPCFLENAFQSHPKSHSPM